MICMCVKIFCGTMTWLIKAAITGTSLINVFTAFLVLHFAGQTKRNFGHTCQNVIKSNSEVGPRPFTFVSGIALVQGAQLQSEQVVSGVAGAVGAPDA